MKINKWGEEEIELLVKYYPVEPLDKLKERLPNRNKKAISIKAGRLGLSPFSTIPKFCKIENCGNKHCCGGYCQKHYDKYRETPERKKARQQSSRKSYLKNKDTPEYKESALKRLEKYRTKNRTKIRESDNQRWRQSPKRRYNRAKKVAKNRSIEFTLTIEHYSNLIKQPCYYECGNNVSETGIGLDRKDNTKGYTLENSVPCCAFCNIIKDPYLTESEMLEIIKVLKKCRKKEKIWENYVIYRRNK